MNRACCEACGNLKAAILVDVVFLMLCTLVTIYFADEVPLTVDQLCRLSDSAPLLDDKQQDGLEFSKPNPALSIIDKRNGKINKDNYERDANAKHDNFKVGEQQNENFMDVPGAVLVNLLTSLRHLPPAMHSVLVVMALTWIGWGGKFIMGIQKGALLKLIFMIKGVREGAFGLILNSVVLGTSCFFIEPTCKWIGMRLVWAISNFTVFVCMASTAIISLISMQDYSERIGHVPGANTRTKVASLVVFVLLGFPVAITSSVPFAVTAELTADSGGGQGLAIGVLNLPIVVPQPPDVGSGYVVDARLSSYDNRDI